MQLVRRSLDVDDVSASGYREVTFRDVKRVHTSGQVCEKCHLVGINMLFCHCNTTKVLPF